MGASRDPRFSGVRRDIGGMRGYWGLLGGVRVYWGGKLTGSPTTLAPVQGPSTPTGSPGGSDLPGQGQASDRNELWRLLYTFGTIFHDSLHICIYTSTHILAHNIKKCYMDCFLCRPIYAYPYMINLMYDDTMVLIMQNYCICAF